MPKFSSVVFARVPETYAWTTSLDGRSEISDLPIFRSTELLNGPEKNNPNRSPEMLRGEMGANLRG